MLCIPAWSRKHFALVYAFLRRLTAPQLSCSRVEDGGSFALNIASTVHAFGLQVKSLLNAVSALPQLEQAVKLIARIPQAKWAADLHKIASMPWSQT